MFLLLKSIDWKTFLKGPLFIVIVAVVAFLAGQQTAPEKVKVVTETKTVEVHHESTQVTQQVNIDELLRKIQDKTRFVDRDVVRIVTIKPDGTRVEQETDRSKIDTTQHTDTTQQTQVSQVSEIKKFLDSYKQEEKIRIVEKLKAPDLYRVGVMAGYGKDANIIPSAPSWLLVGAFAERRVLGNLNAGVWANTMKAGGLQLSYSF